MKTKEYLKNLQPGEVVNKRGLAYLKRLGYIWDYSQWGYLESLRIWGVKREGEQLRTVKVGELRTQWCICVPNMDDRVMIVSRDGKNKTVIVENDHEWAWKIMARKVLASGGAKGLFDCLVQGIGDKHADFHFTCLEHIWKITKSIF